MHQSRSGATLVCHSGGQWYGWKEIGHRHSLVEDLPCCNTQIQICHDFCLLLRRTMKGFKDEWSLLRCWWSSAASCHEYRSGSYPFSDIKPMCNTPRHYCNVSFVLVISLTKFTLSKWLLFLIFQVWKNLYYIELDMFLFTFLIVYLNLFLKFIF